MRSRQRVGRKRDGTGKQRLSRGGLFRYGRAGLAALGLAGLASALVPASASAAPARYVYEMCDSALPGASVPAGITVVGGSRNGLTPFDTCASPGGSIGIGETGPASGTYTYLSIPVAVTPGGYVESLAISAAANDLGTANDHTFVYEQGWPRSGAGETQRLFQVASAPSPYNFGSGFSILMNCDGNVGPCGSGPIVDAHYFAATEVDPVAPTVSKLEGSLLAGGTLRGHQTLRALSQRQRRRPQQRLGQRQRPAGRPAQGPQLRRRIRRQPRA